MSTFDYGPTRVLAIVATPGAVHLMWWPRARDVVLNVQVDHDDDWTPFDTRRARRSPHREFTLTVRGDMQRITARTMEAAWAAAQERWAQEDAAALAAPMPALDAGPA
jgi:hypothetical protein